MTLLRTERFPAFLLLASAIAGLAVANSPFGADVIGFFHLHVAVPGTAIDLSLSHWVSDGLLAVFFFAVSAELQFELTKGQLRSVGKAVQPAIAAAGGVLAPVAVFLAVTAGSGGERGWPIPTATDVAFALGVLAVFGRGLPSGVRVFLLALAILDDIVGIVFIAVLFSHDIDVWALVGAFLVTAVVAVLSRCPVPRPVRPLWWSLIGVLALAVWVLVLLAGVHATIAGVLLGLAIAQRPALRARHALEPTINGAILPLFAFTASLVVVPAIRAGGLSPVFWAILVALPVGKIVGITAAGWIAQRLFHRGGVRLPLGDLLAAGALGGIGFTVSLLLAGLAFAEQPAVRDEATLGVLAGSLISVVVAAIVVSWRARWYRRAGAVPEGAEPT